MFDVGFSELILLAVVALVVLGPEKLPHAARMAGAWLGRIRRTVTSIQIEIEKEVAASELKDRMNKEIERLKAAANPVEEELLAVENTIRQSLEDKPEPTADTPANVDQTAAAVAETAVTISTDTHIKPEEPEAITSSVLELATPMPADVAPVPVNLSKSQPL